VGAKVREILAVNRQAEQKFDVERFNLRKLNKLEVMKQYQINPLPVQFKTLLHGQKGCIFSAGI